MLCAVCESGYYLDTSRNRCQVRQLIDHCETYHVSQDTCTACASGYYFDPETQTCDLNPTGRSFCLEYDSRGINCVTCQ